MATILENVYTLSAHLEDAYDALGAKGATIPATKNAANLSATIDTVPAGGQEQFWIEGLELSDLFGLVNADGSMYSPSQYNGFPKKEIVFNGLKIGNPYNLAIKFSQLGGEDTTVPENRISAMTFADLEGLSASGMFQFMYLPQALSGQSNLKKLDFKKRVALQSAAMRQAFYNNPNLEDLNLSVKIDEMNRAMHSMFYRNNTGIPLGSEMEVKLDIDIPVYPNGSIGNTDEAPFAYMFGSVPIKSLDKIHIHGNVFPYCMYSMFATAAISAIMPMQNIQLSVSPAQNVKRFDYTYGSMYSNCKQLLSAGDMIFNYADGNGCYSTFANTGLTSVGDVTISATNLTAGTLQYQAAYMFSGSKNLQHVGKLTIYGNNVGSSSNNTYTLFRTFYACSALTAIDGIELHMKKFSYGLDRTFSGLSSIAQLPPIVFGNELTAIGGLPDTLTIENCPNLTSLTCDFSQFDHVPTLTASSSFNLGAGKQGYIKIPASLSAEWTTATNWSNTVAQWIFA